MQRFSNRALLSLVCLLLTLAIPVHAAEADLLGEWFPAETTKGGLGKSRIFAKEGKVTTTFGAAVVCTYKVNGNKLIFSAKGEEDQEATPMEYKITGKELIISNTDGGDEPEKLTRGADSNGDGLVGKWEGTFNAQAKQIMEFFESGNLYLSVIMREKKGTYSVKGTTLKEEIDGKNDEWEMTIVDDSLRLVGIKNQQTEVYKRKK